VSGAGCWGQVLGTSGSAAFVLFNDILNSVLICLPEGSPGKWNSLEALICLCVSIASVQCGPCVPYATCLRKDVYVHRERALRALRAICHMPA